MLVWECDELDLVSFFSVDSQLGHVPACSEGSEEGASEAWACLQIDVMIASNETLDCENLVGGECAEDMSDSQRLGISVKYDICSSNPSERCEGLLFVRVAIDVCSE